MVESETGDSYRIVTCGECGNEYPVGGSGLRSPVKNSPESAEHHDLSCSVHEALQKRGQTADRTAHWDLDTDS